MSADGSRVAVVHAADISFDSWSVQLWFGPRWRRMINLPRQTQAGFSPDGRYLVTTSFSDESGTVWSARTGRKIAALGNRCLCELVGPFSADGRYFITSSNDTTDKRIWETATGTLVAELRGHLQTQLDAAVFNDRGTQVVTASDFGSASVWEVRSGRRLAVLRGHRGRVLAAFMARDGSIRTASTDGTARVWRFRPTEAASRVPGEVTEAASVRGGLVALVERRTDRDDDGDDEVETHVWRATIGPDSRLWRWRSVGVAPGFPVSKVSPEGTRVLFFFAGSRAGVLDLETAERRSLLPDTVPIDIERAVFSPGGAFVATPTDRGLVSIWRSRTWRLVRSLRGLGDSSDIAPDIALSPDARLVFAAPFESSAGIWRVGDGKRLARLSTLTAIYDAAFSRDGALLVAAAEDQAPRV